MDNEKENKTIIRKSTWGLIVGVKGSTGEILFTQKPNSRMQQRIDKGEPMKIKRKMINKYDCWQYSMALHERIVGLRLQGMSYSEMAKLDRIPPAHTIFSWKRKYPEFAIDLANARKDRAEYFFDKVEEIANTNWEKNEVANAKLRAQLFKWLCEKSSPSEFSPKISPDDGSSSKPVVIINTGVPTPPDERPIILQ